MSRENTPKRKCSLSTGIAQRVAPNVRRIVAENPSSSGTTSALIRTLWARAVAVIDPCPMIEEHVDKIEVALNGETVTHIIVTHTHMDHSWQAG